MARKKWTAIGKEEVTDAVVKLREKRKWQVAYRRFVLEKLPSGAYAPYFGLDCETLRSWFECQFTRGAGWENFGKAWQFGHVLSTHYFDFSSEDDLRLCWNYTNMRVELLDAGADDGLPKGDILSAKGYFVSLYERTGIRICKKMLEKINALESRPVPGTEKLIAFISRNKEKLESIGGLTKEEFTELARGEALEKILLEREILRKFSGGEKG